MAEISIVIITKNDEGVAVTLNNLKNINYPCAVEIVVIDASDSNNYLDDIRSNFPNVKWINLKVKHKFSFAEQRNAGIKNSKGKFITFIDCDCKPDKLWLAELYDAYKKDSVVKIIASQNKSTGKVTSFENDTHDNALIKAQESGANGLFIPSSVFDDMGYFDENFSYGEDVDFTWRAQNSGYPLYRNTSAIIYHDWGNNRQNTKRAYRYGKARAKLYRKHKDRWRQLLGYDIYGLVYGLYIVFLPVALVFPPYLLALFFPLIKNLRNKPLSTTLFHLVYGAGFMIGTVTKGLRI